MEAQLPTDRHPFISHWTTPSAAAAETIGVNVVVPTVGATNNGRLRATLPKAPEALPANRHTVRQQEREDRPRQRVITVRVSADIQSQSPSRKQEPSRRICAVLRSSLSHRKSKETNAGART